MKRAFWMHSLISSISWVALLQGSSLTMAKLQLRKASVHMPGCRKDIRHLVLTMVLMLYSVILLRVTKRALLKASLAGLAATYACRYQK